MQFQDKTLQIMKKTILLAFVLFIASSSYCQWTHGYLRDELGDKTFKKFIVFTTQNASFSKEGKVNVNKNRLRVKIKVQTNFEADKYPYCVSFELFEANSNKAKNRTSVYAGTVELQVKLSNSRIMKYSMFATSADLRIMLFTNDKDLIDLMLKETKLIRCLIKIDSQDTISQYNFTIDPTGFAAMFNGHIALDLPQESIKKSIDSPQDGGFVTAQPSDIRTNNKVDEDEPFFSVEQMPQYPGGDKELMKFIRVNLKYPSVAARIGIEGKVTLRFVINRGGNITNVTVVRSLDPSCDKDAIRIVEMMPKWIPGRQNGRNASVYYTLPIVYKLNK
jgi:TonB family protein